MSDKEIFERFNDIGAYKDQLSNDISIIVSNSIKSVLGENKNEN